MKPIFLCSPAKLNLYLKVLRKRPDGYHDLKTIFERISLFDEMTFSPGPSGTVRIRCSHPQVPTGPKNLIHRAARLLQERYAVKEGADIALMKRIPVAAGLAGGSSNAATALVGLNRLWRLGLPKDELIGLAKELGSDVPFFLHHCRWALGQGRGDEIQPLSLPVKLWHVLVVPRVKMYSREVFTRLNLQLTKPGDDVNILIRSLINKDINVIKALLSNDLESSILAIRASLGRVKDRLGTFKEIEGVSFSGSGPAVFGLLRSRQQAERVRDILSKRYSQVFAVRTF